LYSALLAGLALGADEIAVFALVEKSCTPCHNAKVAQGDVNLKAPHDLAVFTSQRDVWERAAAKMKSGEMPPAGVPKPKAEDVAAVTRWLESEFLRQDKALAPDAGRVAPRRLNRAEYNNTIRDLLGVDLEPAANFPADETAFGFDNVADALNLSPVLLEKYVDAAERVVRTAIFGPEKLKPAFVHYPAPVRIATKIPTKEQMQNYDETGLSTLHSAHFLHRFPVDAEYLIRMTLNGHRPNDSEDANPALYIDGKFIRDWKVEATDLEGQIVEVRVRLGEGEHLISATYLKNYEGLPPRYGGPNPSQRAPLPPITSSNNQTPRLGKKMTQAEIEFFRKYGTRVKTDRVDSRIDNRYESIDIGGPYEQKLGPDPVAKAKVFVCSTQTEACAARIVGNFARRAFRRPVSAAETARYTRFVALAQKQGDSFEEGIATALQAVLVSPKFLFRTEEDRATPAISDYELASRLSYFLWSSTPDETLLRLAAAKSLRHPGVIEAQVLRMLRDEKAAALVENFAGQWLQFKNMDVMKPDLERFQNFDDGLRRSMRRETAQFVGHIFRENRSVLELLDADYSFLDERLGRFYGVPGIRGPEFRKVDMTGTKRGGGVLAHASVLTVSSYSTRTSPVLRGKWILENLLNAPPPEPPPGVPALDDTKIGESASLREQMEAHRKNPACASCHARMDPLGFGLENLDAIGAWRDLDGKFPVDSSGILPNGQSFQGPVALKKLLREDREAFVRGLTQKLMTYALGRGLERYDRRVANEIAAELAQKDFRFGDLAVAIVKSYAFQNRRPVKKT
jgi:hypothetical protein